MLDLIAEGKPPAYWAPFVVVGEGGARGQTLDRARNTGHAQRMRV